MATETIGPSHFVSDLFALHAELDQMKFLKEADNPFFKSKYMDLPSLKAQIAPVLTKHNFIWITTPGVSEGKPTLGYTLLHKTGESVKGEALLPEGLDAQKMGGAITYFRRYVLTAVLDIVADDDDDGNNAAGAQPRKNVTEEKYRKAVAQLLAKAGQKSDSYQGKPLASMNEKELLAAGKALAAQVEES